MNKFILLLLSLITVSSFADSKYGNDSIQCIQNISVYREFYKQKNYDDAISPWRWAYLNCPRASKNLYIDGAKLFKHVIKKTKGDNDKKLALVDSLMLLYDQRVSFFGQEGYVLGLKGSDMLKYLPSSLDDAFALLKKSVAIEERKSKATALLSYFQAATKKFEEGTFDKSDVLEVYAIVSDYIDYNLINNTKSKKYYEKAASNIEKLFVPFATCEDLISMFDLKYSQTPDDLILLKRITKVLDKKDCTDATVYFNAAAKLHELDPTAYSAYSMGNLSLKKNKSSEAISYYQQALDMAEKKEEKANYYYGLSGAYFKSGSYQKARSIAYQSLEIKPDWGKPYILIGDIYAAASASCGDNPFENGMVFSAAIDKFIKAKKIDESLTDFANKKIAIYSQYLPSTEDAFFSGSKEGDVHQIGCWINEGTKVRLK